MTTDATSDVQELSGAEGGRWVVWTRDSSYLFDLDAGSVIRRPGPTARAGMHDRPRPLRSIEKCRVGSPGYWTMHAEQWSATFEFFWAHTTTIRSIERLSDD